MSNSARTRRRPYRIWSCLAAAGLSVAIVGQGATAASGVSDEQSARDAAVAFYRGQYDVAASVAVDRLTQQDAFTTLVTELTSDYGINSFDPWIEGDADTQILNIRTDVPRIQESVRAGAARLGIAVEMHDEPSFLSQAVTWLADESGDDATEGQYVDVQAEVVVIQTTAAATTNMYVGRSAGADVPVAIDVIDEPGGDDAIIRGGVALGGCTAGFAARQGSYIGFYTASHCGSSQQYWATTAASGSAAGTSTRRNYVHNANADMAFHSISGNNAAATMFTASSVTPVAVGSAADVAQGTTVCSRGKSSGYRCGTVASIAYKPTWSGACNGVTCSSLFVSVNATSAGGDSGGPWFVSGNRPIGINKGHAGSVAVYSRLSQAPSGTSLY